ncbi:MAG: hypothetical protein SOZ07_01815 [Prevotella sp.]|nr:hypothetical protein [Prevotella sp.]MDD7273812.1 hypothetical protein [Prevotellaceae bacterium]MDY3935382.1 hypothetical protein [Prevotella sp.]MDY4217785.1 hypothetical protein [Prevotella sp.]
MNCIFEHHIVAPSTYSLDGGDKIPISNDDSDEEPTGAKGVDWDYDFNSI